MSLSAMILVYVIGLLVGISLVALYFEMRSKRFEPSPTEDRIFRCRQCGYVYTDDPDVDRSRCPQCATFNERFHF